MGALLYAFDQTRVAAHLPQLEQRIKNADLRALKAAALQRAAHLLVCRNPHGLVQLALAALQLHAQDDFGARRQFAGNVLLSSAQYEGTHALRQQLGAQGFTVLLDGLAPARVETAHVAQKARHQEIELRPQFAQVVFERGAGQAQQVRRSQLAQGTGAAAARVFHHLGLVEDEQMKWLCRQGVAIAPQQWIGGEHQVVPGHVRMAFCAPGAVQAQHPQVGGHACGLGLPIEEQRGGQHYQCRVGQAPSFFFGQHMGQRLRGFAQAHVVGQDAPQALGAQVLQPSQAV